MSGVMNHKSPSNSQSSLPFATLQKCPSNPILSARGSGWESLAVFNPAAWTDGERVYLLYRAEGPSDSPTGRTSCIGFAVSTDGIRFVREAAPILFPTEDYERPCGCEDPRIVQIDGIYYMTYTAYDGKVARLALAKSNDLRYWQKLGLLLPDGEWDRMFPREEHRKMFPRGWSKSGAILPKKLRNKFWMYFGDTHIWVAHSEDVLRWEVVEEPVLSPRPSKFDSRLVEPGPPPLFVGNSIWFGYNSADAQLRYSFGYCLLSIEYPEVVTQRCNIPILEPSSDDELAGQVPNVVFAEGLVFFRGQYLLYYGMADSRIGVAIGKPILGCETSSE